MPKKTSVKTETEQVTTSAPVVENNLIKLYMNGLFDVPEGSQATYNNINTKWPERLAHAHSE